MDEIFEFIPIPGFRAAQKNAVCVTAFYRNFKETYSILSIMSKSSLMRSKSSRV